jgi:amidohydrolase
VIPSLTRALGEENVRLGEPLTGSEDFSYYANEAPGFFFFLGGLKPGTTSGDHHTPTFRVDDAAVPVGMRAMTALVLDYLARASARPAARP